MEREQLELMRKSWYNTDAVAFELINSMKHRESVFIATNRRMTHRMLKINAVRFLYKNFEKYEFFTGENEYNIYSSVANFPELPMASWKWAEKQEQQAKFNASFMDFVTGYDFFLDLDNPDIPKVYEATKIVKELLDKFGVSYSLIFSGTKGFHISVSYDDFPVKLKQMKHDRVCRLFKLFAYELKLMLHMTEIDTSIFDMRRIRKVPYSVAYPNYNVALPLSDMQFNSFNIGEMHISKMLPQAGLMRKRGLLKRNGEPDNFLRLIGFIATKREKCELLFRIMKIHKQTLYGMMVEMESGGGKDESAI